ncbi:hypothetical protein KPL78_12015 [Roseomonas sp. HJA6]|uniref:Uncharacterized protein n=1 Tax=Roseomonas alba TaxID=2846776 RepID=A0ABS7A914_9PROT|nr:hypothetical protein [Neoroseomonas alba]MBW6398580.1 hypothetical protein [Neoroseomonas alba]
MAAPFDAEAVREALDIFEGPQPSAERLVALVGSWDELLAHLLLVRGALPEDVDAAIRAATQGRRGAASPRPPGPDARRLRETEEALAAAMTALTAAEAAARAAADAASAALGAYVAERPVASFDLHLRIGPGGG